MTVGLGGTLEDALRAATSGLGRPGDTVRRTVPSVVDTRREHIG
jgi:hypothetical protein